VVLLGLALSIWEFLRRADPPPSEQMQLQRDERQRQFFANVLRAIRKRPTPGARNALETQKRRPNSEEPGPP
jgi:hypothetical protein